jgi:hypothetical protein
MGIGGAPMPSFLLYQRNDGILTVSDKQARPESTLANDQFEKVPLVDLPH